MMIKIIVFIFFSVMQVVSTFALRPVDSLLFGPSKVQGADRDPLQHVFYQDDVNNQKQSNDQRHMKKLGLYAGFIHEGHNLKNHCDKSLTPLRYKNTTEYQNVKRSYLTNLQDSGLDLVSRFLPHYAEYFEFSRQEYQNLVDSLVGNYCSQNVSIISLRELKKNMMQKFDRKEKLELPSVLGNPYFPDKLERLSSLTEVKKKELYYTLELFKGLCSWGGQTHDYRLMTPLVSHPAVAAMVVRKMTSTKLKWNDKKEKTALIPVSSESNDNILCENYICRKSSALDYERKLPRSIGSLNLKHDLEKLYCEEFRHADYKIKNQLPKIKKMMKSNTFSARHALVGQFVALTTSIPDFLTHVKVSQSMDDLYRSSMDRDWAKWARLEKKDKKESLFFEESLVVEAQKRDLRELYKERSLKVDLHLSLGEYDRIGGDKGKVSAAFTFPLKKEFLEWAITQVKSVRTRKEVFSLTKLNETLVARVKYALRENERKLGVVPWQGKEGLEKVIAHNILQQLPHYQIAMKGSYSDTSIEVSIHYGLFALGYIRDLQQIQRRENQRHRENSIYEKMASKSD